MKHLKIGLVGLGVAMLILAVGISLVGSPVQAEMSGVGVRVANGEVAVNVPTDTALDAFDRFLDRFLPPKEDVGTVRGPTFGALSSPDIQSNWIRVGGVTRWSYRSDNLHAASTTICSIQAPSATSTLVSAVLYLDIGSSTEFAVDIGKGLTPNSTSSVLYNAFSVGANLKAMIRASTTPTTSTAESDLTFSAQVATTTGNGIVPGTEQFLNFVGYQPAAEETGTFTPTGHCQAVFEEL